MTFWLIIWGGTITAWAPVFYLAVREPAQHAPQYGLILAAIFMAVQPLSGLLSVTVAQVMWRRARARREARLLARVRAALSQAGAL